MSIALNQLMFRTVDPLERAARRRPWLMRLVERETDELAELPPSVDADRLRDHAVLVGYGRVGKPVARAFDRYGIPYLVIEQDRELARTLQRRGLPVIYVDATKRASSRMPTSTARDSSSFRPRILSKFA